MQSITDIRFFSPARTRRNPIPAAFEALIESMLESVRLATSSTTSSPYRMHQDEHLRGPLADEFRRARWL